MTKPRTAKTSDESKLGESKIETIFQDIYTAVRQKGKVTVSDIVNFTHHSHRSVHRYLNIIKFLQSQPPLEIETIGQYTIIQFQPNLPNTQTKIEK